MANKFEMREWEDRQAQYPSRRRLIPAGQESLYDVERAEGDVTVPGDAFNAQNMNDIEKRVYDAFGKLDATDIAVLDKANVFSKGNVEEVLLELFTSASNGKKAFATAIGGSASSTFQVLADLANSIKTDRDDGKKLIANAIGGSASSTFQVLANLVKSIKDDRDTIKSDRDNGKILISDAIGGSAKPTMTFKQLSDLILSRGSGHYYEGVLTSRTLSTLGKKENSITISIPFGFVPSVVILSNVTIDWYKTTGSGLQNLSGGQISVSNLGSQSVPSSYNFNYGIRNIKSNSIELYGTNKIYESDNNSYIYLHTQSASKVYAFRQD